MMKETIRNAFRKLGVYVASTQRLGIDVVVDLRRLTAGSRITTIFDVGGNFGQTATRFASEFPAATIFTFEPVPTSFSILSQAVENNPRIRAFNTALGDRPGTVRINFADSPGSNSIVSEPSGSKGVDVEADTLDAVAERHVVRTIDLLKIDVEGYELQVLGGASKLLGEGRVRYVYAECVMTSGERGYHTSFFDLNEALVRNGFCFIGYYAESFSLSAGCALGNVLYAHRAALPRSVSGSVRNIF